MGNIAGLKNYNLLFLEDNEEFARNTVRFMQTYFNEVFHALDIENAFRLYEENEIHLIISDIRLKNENGLDFVSKIRGQNSEIPIVVLSSHKDEDFLFTAIPLKLTDYMLKPLSYDEFMQKFNMLKDVLDDTYSKKIALSDTIFYDRTRRELIKDNQSIKLNQKEILFLELLIKNIETIVTREEVENKLWGKKKPTDAAIKNFILRFRKKIGKNTLGTITNIGYQLNTSRNRT